MAHQQIHLGINTYLTIVDWYIWRQLCCLRAPMGSSQCEELLARVADRRDAEMFIRLNVVREYGECYLRIGRQDCLVHAVHVYVQQNPLWPTLPDFKP